MQTPQKTLIGNNLGDKIVSLLNLLVDKTGSGEGGSGSGPDPRPLLEEISANTSAGGDLVLAQQAVVSEVQNLAVQLSDPATGGAQAAQIEIQMNNLPFNANRFTVNSVDGSGNPLEIEYRRGTVLQKTVTLTYDGSGNVTSYTES